MPLDNGWRCAMFGGIACQGTAVTVSMCSVEGRELALCQSCVNAWRRYAKGNPALELRCPRCAVTYMAARAAMQETARKNASGDSGEAPALEGPIADAIIAAMNDEGILFDVRRRVLVRLYRLAMSDSGYAGQLLRTTAKPPMARAV